MTMRFLEELDNEKTHEEKEQEKEQEKIEIERFENSLHEVKYCNKFYNPEYLELK
jgi:hypothetical protein